MEAKEFINSIDNKTFNLIRNSLSDAECRRYLKEQLTLTDVATFCECGGNERVALDCTMKPCKHPKYNL